MSVGVFEPGAARGRGRAGLVDKECFLKQKRKCWLRMERKGSSFLLLVLAF